MPTLANFDPTRLPAYPSSPHKTGQARVFIDDRSQYLGRFGTNESHALYHLMCLRKLVDGKAPATRELRAELQGLVGDVSRPKQWMVPLASLASAICVIGLFGFLTYYATRSVTSASVRARKPLLGETLRGPSEADNPPAVAPTDFSEVLAKYGELDGDPKSAIALERTERYFQELKAELRERRRRNEGGNASDADEF